LLALFGAVAWDLSDDRFWLRHPLITNLVASLIVVAVTAAALNELLQHRQRQRWAVLAPYALFDFVRLAGLVWSGLLELADLEPEGELGNDALAAGSGAVRDTPRLAAAMDEILARTDRREQLHRLNSRLVADGQNLLGRWADVMVNSGKYAEIMDGHVELYSRLTGGSLDQTSFELAFRIVSPDWWAKQQPDRPSPAEPLPTQTGAAASPRVGELNRDGPESTRQPLGKRERATGAGEQPVDEPPGGGSGRSGVPTPHRRRTGARGTRRRGAHRA
jgi:hypothetical protein